MGARSPLDTKSADIVHTPEDKIICGLSEQVKKLERFVGSLHEPAEEEHTCLLFDVSVDQDLPVSFSDSWIRKYCETLERRLSCDQVLIRSLQVDLAIVSTAAIGF